MEMTLEKRLALAAEARAKGYNCAQATMAAFPDLFLLPEGVSLRLGAALGAGMGGTGSTCGVLTAMALGEGMLTPGAPGDKVAAYKGFHALSDEFARRHGSTLCPALKASGIDCDVLIAQGVEAYHNRLAALEEHEK